MILHFGEDYECDKVIKGADYIHVYKDGSRIMAFEGISDFADYSLEGGDYSAPEVTEQERLRADVDFLLMLEGDIV